MDSRGHVSEGRHSGQGYTSYNTFPNGQDPSPDPNWNYAFNHVSASHSKQASVQPGWPQANPRSTYESGPYPETLAIHHRNPNFHGGLNPYPQSSSDISSTPRSIIPGAGFNGQFSSDPNLHYQSGTIAPQALQNNIYSQHGDPNAAARSQQFRGESDSQDVDYNQSKSPMSPSTSSSPQGYFPMPKGVSIGDFVVTDFHSLVRVTNSKRLHNFVNIGESLQEIPITKTTIPGYLRRNSRNDFKKFAAGDKDLMGKIAKKHSTKIKSLASVIERARAVNQFPIAPGNIKVETPESSTNTESSDDASAYDSSDEEDGEPAEPSPLPNSRPNTPLEATRYDAVKALWRPRNLPVAASDIREALKSYWDLVRTIRDRWKSDAAAVKEAEEKKRTSELPLLEDRVKNQRDMIEVAFKAALDHGHKNITELFSENQPLILLYNQFLADRARSADYDCTLSQSILQLLSQCKTLSHETLEKTGVLKVLPRFTKKGNEETRALVKAVLSNLASKSSNAAGSSLVEKLADSKATEFTAKANEAIRRSPEQAAGVKRPRPSDMSNGQPQKKVASASALPQLKAAVTASGTKRPMVSAQARPASTNTGTATAKPKALQVTAKPSGFFSSLQSAKKKPGTSNADLAAVKDKMGGQSTLGAKKSSQAATTSNIAKPAFSFAETMANLANPKDKEPKVKPEEKLPPETQEQRAVRLRKESRRKLRVSFKPEDELVQVRYFTHDPEEDLGHDANMVRDVGDIGGEGRMFKQHKDMMDLDDEDDAPTNEESPRQYMDPSLVDFDVVDQDERNRNHKPFGGGVLQPTSPESSIQQQLEDSTLVVIYTDISDIPPSPREPVTQNTEDAVEVVAFGAPPDHILARAANPPPQQPQAPVSVAPPATNDLSALLTLMNSQQSLQQQQQPQPPQHQNPLSDLEKLFAQHSNQYQQPTIPQPQQNQAQMSMPAGQGTDFSTLFASLGQQNAQPPQQAPPGFPPVAGYMQASGFPESSATNNLSAILAQLQQPATGYPYENEERRRWREIAGAEKDGGDKPKKSGKMFVVPCRFWKAGQCKKGAECTFVHD